MFLGNARADNEQVAVDDSRSGDFDGSFVRIDREVLAEVYPAGLAEGSDELARFGVERVDGILDEVKDARFLAIRILPIHDAAIATAEVPVLRVVFGRIKAPHLFAGGSIQCDGMDLGSGEVKEAIDHYGI